MKKKKSPLVLQFDFADGTSDTLTLIESEMAKLREMCTLLNSDFDELRSIGEKRLKSLAERLANERNLVVRAAGGSPIGAAARRAAGDRTADAVTKLLSLGEDPLTITSERNLRRIKDRKKSPQS